MGGKSIGSENMIWLKKGNEMSIHEQKWHILYVLNGVTEPYSLCMRKMVPMLEMVSKKHIFNLCMRNDTSALYGVTEPYTLYMEINRTYALYMEINHTYALYMEINRTYASNSVTEPH